MSAEQVEILEGIKEKIQSAKERLREQADENIAAILKKYLQGEDRSGGDSRTDDVIENNAQNDAADNADQDLPLQVEAFFFF